MKDFIRNHLALFLTAGLLIMLAALGQLDRIFGYLGLGLAALPFFHEYVLNKGGSKPSLHQLLWFFGLGISIVLRWAFFQEESGDFVGNLEPWFNELTKRGFGALADPFYDYSPAYMYLLYLGSLISTDALTAVKVIALIGDLFLAYQVYRLTLSLSNQKKAQVASLLVLLLPTVVLNSAMWGQCDALYTACLLWSIRGFVKGDNLLAWVAIGCAFTLKLQTIFIALLPLVIYFRRKHNPAYILMPLVLFFLSVVPVWIAGRPLSDLMSIYLDQSGHYQALTLHAPSAYALLGWANAELFTRVGIIFSAGIVILFTSLLLTKESKIERNELVPIALLSLVLIPFFLPGMHERYFYPADVLSIVFVVLCPKRFYLALLIQLASLFSYFHFLLGGLEVFPQHILALVMGLALLILIKLNFNLFPRSHDTHS